jgi:L-aspartate oxidase
MWTGVGLERTAPGLRRALRDIESDAGVSDVGSGELGNLRLVARMVARAAWARTESRGAHFRTDIPWQDPHWKQHLYFDGETLVEPQPIAVAG